MAFKFNISRFNIGSGNIVAEASANIVFGGVYLTEAVPKAKIINISIDMPTIESTYQSKVIRAGAYFRRLRYATRHIGITVELPLDKKTYAINIRKLIAWCQSEEPRALRLPVYREDEIYVTLTNAGELNVRDFWLPVELEFTAWDPCFISVDEHVADVGDSFTISGDEMPQIWLEHRISGSLTDPEWIFPDGYKVKLSGTFATGLIVIDFDNLTITHNDRSIMANLTLNSRFPRFKPGTFTVTGPAGGILKWKERWL